MERPNEDLQPKTAPACANPESAFVKPVREPAITYFPAEDTPIKEPTRQYNSEELEYLYHSMPIIGAFKEIRKQIADVMMGLRKGTSGNRELRIMIDGAYNHWETQNNAQDRKFRMFIRRENMARHKKTN